ncbi:hypothetical protein BC939DRAFT_504079 [Gamsiella multidivaricata]|uniref:uncharacterized protein n=1 Tax=Gamsiella multidivaricata TaxID=101098 RepID=UPI00221E51A5|nr:uncharacterized protein BC939DRAFT_504079 [Gamsiella multidivaricata]KAI7822040.1 hypothetical protein BC939DRAFT_504079 [Gamsiella multidivaricata]
MFNRLLLVVIVIVISILLFSILFIYLYRVYKRLQVRHLKPLPTAIPPGLEQHQEFAFVLAHGVEAYNEQRRQRHRQQRVQARATAATAGAASSGSPPLGDTASIHSTQPSLVSEPPPEYSPDPVNGDVGYGWRSVDHAATLFAQPAFTGEVDTTAHPTLSPLQPAATYPLDSSLPPVYIYQTPSTRSTAQAALLSTDNSPSVTVPAAASSDAPATSRTGRQGSRRRSVISGILTRGARTTQRSMSMASSRTSSSSRTASVPEIGDASLAITITSVTPPPVESESENRPAGEPMDLTLPPDVAAP